MDWGPIRASNLLLFAAVAGCSDNGPRNEQFSRVPDPIEIGNESEPASANQSPAVQINQTSENSSHETLPMRGPRSAADTWIVGNWIGPTGSCFHATVYNADGTWFSGGNSGTWTLAGDTLTHVLLEQEGSDPDSDAVTRVPNPRPEPSTVTSRATNAFTQRGPDGQSWEMTRCPSNP
jgi:hypothetical protein